MVYQSQGTGPRLDRTFAALADPTRRRLLGMLGDGPAPIGVLASRFRTSLPAVSKHLRVLQRAGLVRIALDASDRRVRTCTLREEGLDAASRWLMETRAAWNVRLDAMERAVALRAATP